MPEGQIVLLGALLGNSAAVSPRWRSVLADADVIAVADPRWLARLARDLEVVIAGRVVSFDGADDRRGPAELVAAAGRGARVALVTDDGTAPRAGPSDPVRQLVSAAHQAGMPVTVVPGPSAVITALAISGLPGDRFCVEGSLPRAAEARQRRLARIADEPRTLVLFAPPSQLRATLAGLSAVCGADRPAAWCRDLDEADEQVRRGGLAELADEVVTEPAGETIVVVAGAPPASPPELDLPALRAAVAARQAAGWSHRDAVTEVATEFGLRRRDVYQASLTSG